MRTTSDRGQGEQEGQQRVGNYRLVRLIGKGGFADVYLGEHIHLNTLAAVKLLHTRLADGDIEEFRGEARMIAHLVHPNIVRVLDFGVENNLPYLVMDYAPDGTLRQRHPKGSMLPIEVVVTYVKQVAEALQYAHEQRLIHRDIKPENMLIGRNSQILLSDFGIALATQSSHYSSTQNVAGTVAYMAPEQLQAHPRPASDQYSLGIVAYEWLSGQRPFHGSFSEIAVKHTLMPPPPLRPQRPDISADVELVLMTALQKDPQRRFPTVRAFAQTLEQVSLQGRYTHPNTTFSTTSAPSIVAKTTQFMHSGSSRPVTPAPVPPLSPVAQPTFLYNTNLSTSQPYHYPVGNSPPSSPFPPTAPVSSSSERPSRRLSRRAFVAGTLGLVAVSSGVTWYVATRFSHNANPVLSTLHSTLPGSGTSGTPSLSASSDTPVLTYSAQQNYVWAVDWSPNGRYIASGSLDGSMHVWTATTGKRILSYRSSVKPAVSDDYVMGVAWSPDSTKVAMAFIDGTVQVVDSASGEMVYTFGTPPAAPYYAVSWSPNGDYLAAASGDNTVKVFNVKSGSAITTFDKHTDTVLTVAWSYDGKMVASGAVDGKAKVWNPMTGEEMVNYTEHTGEVRAVAWSHDSTRLASASWDGTAKVWQASTGNTLYTYTEHPVQQMMDSVSWSHHDTYVAFGGHDQYLRICDAKSGTLVHSLTANPVYSQAWSPDDHFIVTGGISDKRVQIWKLV